MKYLKYTYVDSITGIPVTEAPTINGPSPPAIDGLQFSWARESQYPTNTPEFFGTCPDDTFSPVAGIIDVLTKADFDNALAGEISARKQALLTAINTRRDSLEESGFPYLDKQIDSDPRSVQRISTAVQAAQAAVGAGQPFSIDWTCADDSTLTLDAAGMMGMPVALAMHANAIHQHARALKSAVEAATSSADLEAIDITAGWPGQPGGV